MSYPPSQHTEYRLIPITARRRDLLRPRQLYRRRPERPSNHRHRDDRRIRRRLQQNTLAMELQERRHLGVRSQGLQSLHRQPQNADRED